MSLVTEKEFFQIIGPRDVHPHILPSRYPYTSVFRTPGGREVGRITPVVDGRGRTCDEYHVSDNERR